MSPKAAEVLEQARQLSADERRELALDLLDASVEPNVEAAWTEEALRRVAQVDSGELETLSNEDALRIIAADD
ncbi:MAG: addiction module protein [Myxococcales bacterium]|nr:addiction module protein [Myxococcales bacterium]MDD9972081.1 addiction module protein [Myxococcales bacterium]